MLAAFRQRRFPRYAVLATVLTGFLLALVLAAAPGLHESIHHDDYSDGGTPAHHECLVTILAAGGCGDVLGVVAVLLEPAPVPAEVFIAPTDERLGSFYLSSRPLEHAPPLFSQV